MAKITLDKAEEGMIVLEDVKGPNGQCLLSAGGELTSKLLRVMKTWGVHTLTIEGDDEEDAAQAITVSPESQAEAEKEIEFRFLHTDRQHPIMNFLFGASARARAIEKSRNS